MRLPDFLTPSEIEEMDLHEWERQTVLHIRQLNHQLFHTTLAHLLRDCEGLEALRITCGKHLGMVVSKGIEPLWQEAAPKTAREHYKKTFKRLLERMLGAKVQPTLFDLFGQVVNSLLLIENGTVSKSKISIAKDQWQEYLSLALAPELVARQLAHELTQNMEGSEVPHATASGRSRL